MRTLATPLLAMMLKKAGFALSTEQKVGITQEPMKSVAYLGQRSNPQRNAERRLTRQMGHRQHRMLTKRLRRAEREARWDDEATLRVEAAEREELLDGSTIPKL